MLSLIVFSTNALINIFRFNTLYFQILSLTDLYQPVVDWVDSDLRLFSVTENIQDGSCNQSLCEPKRVSRMPSIAIMLFLSEDGPDGYERIQTAKRRFEKSPWKFHHSEHVSHGKINPYPFNSPDYFYTSEELPLWAVRMVHCGKESIRIVLFTSDECWEDMIRFYRLVIGFEPDVAKDDFCMFTIYSREQYDVQFALKKLKGETKPRALNSVKLQFRVPEVGNLVPLFPNVCKPVSDGVWETHDHDGNVITIDVTGKPRPKSSTPSCIRDEATSQSSRKSSCSSRSSTHSSKSGQSLTSVTSPSEVTSSSFASSLTSSFTSVLSDQSVNSETSTQQSDDDIPPPIPPRVPLNAKLIPPKIPERQTQCTEGLRGFYV
jgi:hypothetical protein